MNEREMALMELELWEASEKLEEVIRVCEKYQDFDNYLENYIIPKLKICVGGDHGYLTMDQGIRDIIKN